MKAELTAVIEGDFYGVVPAGQTMLVLGRPGAGCSTLRTSRFIAISLQDSRADSGSSIAVRAIANERAPFLKVEGHVQYSTIDAKEAEKYCESINPGTSTEVRLADTDGCRPRRNRVVRPPCPPFCPPSHLQLTDLHAHQQQRGGFSLPCSQRLSDARRRSRASVIAL